MPITDPDVLTVSCRGPFMGSEQWANVFHVIGSGAPLDAAEAAGITTCFNDFYTQLITLLLSDQWSHDETEVKQESSGNAFLDNGAGPGASSNAMPPDTAIVLSWRTAVNSRRGRGRTYLCGFVEGQNNDGVIDATHQGNVAAAAAQLGQDLDANGTPLAVYSTVAGVANAVTSVRVGQLWDTQRRRDRRLAENYVSIDIP